MKSILNNQYFAKYPKVSTDIYFFLRYLTNLQSTLPDDFNSSQDVSRLLLYKKTSLLPDASTLTL